MSIGLYNSDCIEKMKELIDKGIQVDSIVTDPPYELKHTVDINRHLSLEVMGKSWDSTGIAFQSEVWGLALKLLKPGGHLLSFGGSRTYHRMAVAIEDAGFEIRDQIMWLYGSGFPKSLNVGKAIDRKQGNDREVIGQNQQPTSKDKTRNKSPYQAEESRLMYGYTTLKIFNITKGNSKWEGWGTALKPAHEPIVIARKLLSEKTVADNVLKHGTGGINIDGCRVGNDGGTGRFPANIIHDGSQGVLSGFPETVGGSAARFFYCAKASKKERGIDNKHPTVKPIELMKYLCRLVKPKGGTVLDMFMGTGTTGIAAKKEGFNFIGIEKETEYFKIAEVRISHDTKEIIETVPKDSSQVKQPSFNDLIDWSD